jgi:hypothetical protein
VATARFRDTQSSITCFTQPGTGTVRTRPPLPTRSTMAQCSSRRCRWSMVSWISSPLRNPQPSRTASMARSLFPLVGGGWRFTGQALSSGLVERCCRSQGDDRESGLAHRILRALRVEPSFVVASRCSQQRAYKNSPTIDYTSRVDCCLGQRILWRM